MEERVKCMVDPSVIDLYIDKLDQMIQKLVYINKLFTDSFDPDSEKPF